jgi:hypothetical protein
MAFTLIVGHLVIQVATIHNVEPFTDVDITNIQTKDGNWDNILMSIWPTEGTAAMWPSKENFTLTGPDSIEHLIDRWRIGINVNEVSAEAPSVTD